MTAIIQNNKHSVEYGQKTIEFSLHYCDRKTMEIAVHPDSSLIVKAPIQTDLTLIEKRVVRRARWILKQQKYFNQFNPKTTPRYYINGETHLYLGKQYRLKIAQGSENSIKLTRGFFLVTCRSEPAPDVVKKIMQKWYAEKAKLLYAESMDRCWKKFDSFGFERPKISVKRMQKRWGSLSKSATVTLNTDLIRAPKECIDYVVTHELCHLKYRDHSSDFYKLLDSVMPEWEKVKHKLEVSLV